MILQLMGWYDYLDSIQMTSLSFVCTALCLSALLTGPMAVIAFQYPGLWLAQRHCLTKQYSARLPVVFYLLIKAYQGEGYKAFFKESLSAYGLCILFFLGLLLHFGYCSKGLMVCALGIWMWILAWMDYYHQYLLDDWTISGLWLGLLVNSCSMLVPLNAAVWGAVWGYMSLWFTAQCFFQVTGRMGMGYGDFKLLAMLGAWMGYATVWPLVFKASLGALIVRLIPAVLQIQYKGFRTMIQSFGKTQQPYQAFGPYLVLAAYWQLLAHY